MNSRSAQACQYILIAALTASFGCDRLPSRDPPDEPPRPVQHRVHQIDGDIQSLLRIAGIDADVEESQPRDPVEPAGDLLRDIEQFESLQRCVETRGPIDPIVGDAIDALGYESIKRDACRVLQAAKNKNVAMCDPILSSSLRSHCAMTVAVATATVANCPLVGSNHDALCVALAQRDERLCAATPSYQRTLCRALLSKDTSKCNNNANCQRRVERWKGLMPDKSDRIVLGTRASVSIAPMTDAATLAGDTFDLSNAIVGATVYKTADTVTVTLGDESVSKWPASAHVTTARVAMKIVASDQLIRQGSRNYTAGSIGFDLSLPRYGRLSVPAEQATGHIHVDMFSTGIGGPVRFTLQTTEGPSYNRKQVSFSINTYVRDVVIIAPSDTTSQDAH